MFGEPGLAELDTARYRSSSRPIPFVCLLCRRYSVLYLLLFNYFQLSSNFLQLLYFSY